MPNKKNCYLCTVETHRVHFAAAKTTTRIFGSITISHKKIKKAIKTSLRRYTYFERRMLLCNDVLFQTKKHQTILHTILYV